MQQAELREEERRKKLRVVIAESEKKLNSAAGLLKAQQVQESALVEYGLKVSEQYI